MSSCKALNKQCIVCIFSITRICCAQVVEILRANGKCDVQYKEYPSGHVPMDEMPDRFLEDLQQFVTEVGSAKQAKPAENTLSDGVDDAPLPLYPPSETAPIQD